MKATSLPNPGQAVKLMGSFGTRNFLFMLSVLPSRVPHAFALPSERSAVQACGSVMSCTDVK